MMRNLLSWPVRSPVSRSIRQISITESPDTDFILAEEIGDKGILTYNRPQAMNATNLEMKSKLFKFIRKWENDKSMIIIKGSGGKAFSAGGDIRGMVENEPIYGRKGFSAGLTLNYTVSTLKTPYIALVDGIVFGGGVGNSIHGKYFIATEKTVFAMPESGIGLFPDAGASYFFTRMQGKLGYYLGLTGSRVKGEDVLHAGIATHYCKSEKLPALESTLLGLKNSNDIQSVLDELCPKPKSQFSLSPHLKQIDDIFNANSVEEILDKLVKENSEWSNQTIKTLRNLCPLSVKVMFRNLKLGKDMSLGECLQMEYRLAIRMIVAENFIAGVRSMLITKDKNPKWNPTRIEDVTDDHLLPLYQPLPDNDELPINVKLNRRVDLNII